MSEENKKTKAEKLIEKVSNLAEKIENEDSIAKRTLYSMRAKILMSRIQRQIDIQEIRQEYSNDREQMAEDAEASKIDSRSEIIEINRQMNMLRSLVDRNQAYDYESPSFIFGADEVERYGGVENYIDTLLKSERTDQTEAAIQMRNIEYYKGELDKLEEELEQKRNKLAEIDRGTEFATKTSRREEKALIVKEKMNIWGRISNFFKNIKEGIKSGRSERKDIKNQKIPMETGESQSREEALQALDEEYEKRRAAIEERYAMEGQMTKHKNASTQANDFRMQVKEAAGKLGYEVPNTSTGEAKPEENRNQATQQDQEPEFDDLENI